MGNSEESRGRTLSQAFRLRAAGILACCDPICQTKRRRLSNEVHNPPATHAQSECRCRWSSSPLSHEAPVLLLAVPVARTELAPSVRVTKAQAAALPLGDWHPRRAVFT